MSVEKPGFKILDNKNIPVSTQEFLIVDLKLEVGAVTDVVNVTAETARRSSKRRTPPPDR